MGDLDDVFRGCADAGVVGDLKTLSAVLFSLLIGPGGPSLVKLGLPRSTAEAAEARSRMESMVKGSGDAVIRTRGGTDKKDEETLTGKLDDRFLKEERSAHSPTKLPWILSIGAKDNSGSMPAPRYSVVNTSWLTMAGSNPRPWCELQVS